MPVWKQKPLTSKDRSEQDKREIEFQNSDYQTPPLELDDKSDFSPEEYLQNVKGYKETQSASEAINIEPTDNTLLDNNNQTVNPEDFISKRNQYYNTYDVNNPSGYFGREYKEITNIAEKVSPYYRRFANTDYITYSQQDWAKILAEYNATKDIYGENDANNWLNSLLKNHTAENQPLIEKYGNAIVGMANTFVGATIMTAGTITGGLNYLFGLGYKTEGLNGWQNFLNNAMDNEWTRYGNNVIKYNTYNPEKQQITETQWGGIGDYPILSNDKQDKTIFNANTVPQLIQQGGFTASMMASGVAEAKLIGGVLNYTAKGINAVSKLSRLQKVKEASNKILQGIKQTERFADNYIIPAVNGTHEGFQEGLNVKIESYQEGINELERQKANWINQRVWELIGDAPENQNEETYNLAKQIAEREYEEKFGNYHTMAEEYIDAVSSKSGITDFYLNSAINGFLNTTLKAGLQSDKIQGALRRGKLTKWAFPEGKFNVSTTNGVPTVTPKFNKAKQALNIIKEPAGEFTEEFSQELSSSFSEELANYSIHKYIDNLYNGESTVDVGDFISGSLAAGFNALGNSLLDKQTWKSGIYGALSSSLGNVALPKRTNKIDEKGNLVYKRNKDGSIKLDNDGNPIVEKVLFGRGTNAEGKKESTWEAARRIMPWRSGLFSNIQETRDEAKRLSEEARLIEEWLRDPEKQAKFDGTVGTLSWAREMESNTTKGNEFGLRNTALGITIHEANMLSKLKGTEFYDSYMRSLSQIANMDVNSKDAQELVATVMEDSFAKNTFKDKSNTEIAEILKGNANKMLNTISEIQQESDKLDKLFGYIDDDTKISLIYGKMAIEDSRERNKQLSSEVSEIANTIENTVERSSLTDKQKDKILDTLKLIAQKEDYDTQVEKLEKLKKDVENLNKRKGDIESEKEILKNKKEEIKVLEQKIKKLEETPDSYIAFKTSTLNESEIMALPANIRAILLNPKTQHLLSTEQQEVIKNLIDKGTIKDAEFTTKINDLAKLQLLEEKYIKEYNNILSDPDSFNKYVFQQKQEVKKYLAKQRFEDLNKIENYSDFAKEYDKFLNQGSQVEIFTVNSALKNAENSNYKKFSEDRQELIKIIDNLDKSDRLNTLDDNSKALFVSALTYLVDNGVDFNNTDEAISQLTKVDNTGNYYLFENYLEELNSTLPDEEKVSTAGISEVVGIYRNIMDDYHSNQEEVKKLDTETKGKPTIEMGEPPIIESSTPQLDTQKDKKEEKPIETPVKPTITEDNNSTNNETFKLKEVDKKNADTNEEQSSGILQEENSLLNVALRFADNLTGYDENTRNSAKDIISNANSGVFDSIESLVTYLTSQSNRLMINYDSNNPVAKLLTHIGNTIQNNKNLTKQREESSQDSDKSNIIKKKERNESSISLINLESIIKSYPNSAISKFATANKILEYLKLDKLFTTTPVMFIIDSKLNEDVKTEMEETKKYYNESTNAVVVAVVEDENGGIILDVDGEKKHFQPIGILPRNDNEYLSGSNRTAIIRREAIAQGGGTESMKDALLKDKNGNIITSHLSSTISAQQPQHIPQGFNNTSVIMAGIADLTQKERDEYNSYITKYDKRNSNVYKQMRRDFLSKLKIDDNQNMVYETSSLNGKTTQITIFRTPVHETFDKNSDNLIIDLFRNNDERVLHSNSRISRVVSELSKLRILLDNLDYTEDSNGNTILTQDSKERLSSIQNNFTEGMERQLRLPTKLGWNSYEIEHHYDGNDNIFTLFVKNINGDKIILDMFKLSDLTDNKVLINIIKPLFLNDDNSPRMRDSKEGFVVWNIDYNDIRNQSTSQKSHDIMKDTYDDGILTCSKDRLQYQPTGVSIEAPFTLNGEPNFFNGKYVTKQAQNVGIIKQGDKQGELKREGETLDADTGAVIVTDEKSSEKKDESQKPEDITKPKKGGYSGRLNSRKKPGQATKKSNISKELATPSKEEEERIKKCAGVED